MSDMRDARLRRALQSAPDADLLPHRRVRRAVLDAARQAVTPAPSAGWWKKPWQALGDGHMPWNAALATVVLATLVTVLWYDREVPGARPDGAGSDSQAPTATAPAAAPPTAEPPAMAAPSEPVPVTPSAASRARKAKPVVKPQPRPAPLPSPQAEAPRERRTEGAVGALRDQPGGDLTTSGPAPQTDTAARQAESAIAARAPAPPPAAAAAAAPAAPAAAMSRAAPPGLASQGEPPVAGFWTHLRIEARGRSVELAREQAPRLAQLMGAMERVAQRQEPLEAPVTVRVELRRGGEAADVLELAGDQVRWTRERAGRRESFTARPQPEQLEAVRKEISRLLQR